MNPWSAHHGDLGLLTTVLRVQPQTHIFGHIHGGWGKETGRRGTHFVNCSVVNAKRELAHGPLIVEVETGRTKEEE